MFASLVVLVGAARSLPPISNSSNPCFRAVAAAVAIAQDATTIDAAILCNEKFNIAASECLATSTKCTAKAGGRGGTDKTCTCFLSSSQCLSGLTPCTTAAPASNTFSDEQLKVDTCVKYSFPSCTEAQCEAFVAGRPIDGGRKYAFLAPIVLICGWVCVVFCIGFAVKLCQRQRAARAQAAATQVAVIAGLGVGKPSAPALTPEPEFLKELEVLNKVNNR